MAINLNDIIRAEFAAFKLFLESKAGYVKKIGDTMTGALVNTSTIRCAYILTSGIHNELNTVGYIDFNLNGQTDRCALNNTGVFFPIQAPTASEPAYVKGGLYFNTTLNKLRVGGATAWETVTSAA